MLVQGFDNVLGWVSIALLVFAVFALFDAAIRREDAYRAADKQTKLFWLIILGHRARGELLPSDPVVPADHRR